jgi:UPF0716 protein FxsA
MPLLVLLLFTALPIAELAVLIKVSQVISLGPTLLLVVGNSMLGLFLLRQQSLNSLRRAQQALEDGHLPVDGVIDAVGLLVAAALLVTPGLITDVFGYALLVPPVRRAIGRTLFERARRSGNVHFDIFGTNARHGGPAGFRRPPAGGAPRGPAAGPGPVIEGEIIEPERRGDDDQRSPWRR